MTRFAIVVLALGAVGCVGDSESEEAVVADSTLVDALADLHLADARAVADTTVADRQAVADSLRAVALASNGLDSSTLADRLETLAEDPERARATYDAIDTRLGLERRGIE